MIPQADSDGRWARAVLAVVGAVTLARLAFLLVYPLDLHPDEAQYWSWSLAPDWGYFSKPPMIAWLIGAATALCGDGEACIKLPIPLLHGLTALLVYAAAQRLYDARAGFLAGAVFVTLPGVSFSAAIASTDPPLLTCWAAALYALVRVREGGGLRWWAGMGGAIGLGLMSKYAMAFFAASLALWLAIDRDARRTLLGDRAGRWGLALAAAIAFALYLPNLLWNVANGFVTFAHTESNANLGGQWFRPAKLAEFLGGQFALFGPILFPCLLWLLIGTRWWRAGRDRLLASFVLAPLAPILILALMTRANANWAAAAYVGATIWVAGAFAAMRARVLVTGSVALHLVFAAVLYTGVALKSGPGVYAGVRLPPWIDPYKRYDGWREVGARITEISADHPGAALVVDERKVLAELLYYVNPKPVAAFAWHPGARVLDHFQLTRPWRGPVGADALVISRSPDPVDMLSHFAADRKLATVTVPIGTDTVRSVRVFYARGFLGYKAARP